jgi:hypothetical protein
MLSFCVEVDPMKIRTDINNGSRQLNEMGYQVRTFYVDPNNFNSVNQFLEALSMENFEIVSIGGGIRRFPEYTEYFEKLVNLVHEKAPRAKFCFNATPTDLVNAVLRTVGI